MSSTYNALLAIMADRRSETLFVIKCNSFASVKTAIGMVISAIRRTLLEEVQNLIRVRGNHHESMPQMLLERENPRAC